MIHGPTAKPYQMQIETTTACNAECEMCPRDKATRSTHAERMEESIFFEAVRQAVEEMGVKIVLPFIDGEPLADSRIVGWVEAMAKRWPAIECGFYSNGSLMTPDKAERLLASGNIKILNISMQGGNKETYERVMKLPWERTVANVEKLLEINERLGKPVEIRTHMCVFSSTAASAPEFKARWESKGAKVCLGAYSNFGGLGSDDFGENPWLNTERKVCGRAVNHIYVFWNGDVGQCCFDLVGSIVYGNLKNQTLLDIWSSSAAMNARKAHYDIDVPNMPPICRNCNAPRFRG